MIGCALAVSRELYDRLRGFDSQMRFWGVEDLDFGLKCWLMGSRILHDPEAVVGHRFRGSFDNFSVSLEHIVVNQLRMARKHFTLAAWTDWVNRCRQRHQGSEPEHPEGLWALAWNLFEAERVSVEHERSYLLGNRQRDEFWYAERFGQDWPQFGTTTASTEPRVLFDQPSQPSPSPSPSPPPRRTILLFGYWPPTDIGIGARQGMLWNWDPIQRNYNGSGYDVLAISPTFQAALGTDLNNPNVPYWGKGTGTLIVDYRATSTDFWNIVAQYNPIAIMSFSRGHYDKSWLLEPFGTNWAANTWLLAISYNDNQGKQQTQTWMAPFVGGAADDPAPPDKGKAPQQGNPPDATLAANARRNSNLPTGAIIAAIKDTFPNPPGNVVPDTNPMGPGTFVSNFMAYHVVWYREWINSKFPNDQSKQCLYSGHTHVGAFVAVPDAQTAVGIQLDELIKVLPKP